MKYFVFINVIVTCLELLDAQIVLGKNSYHFEVVQLFSEILSFSLHSFVSWDLITSCQSPGKQHLIMGF